MISRFLPVALLPVVLVLSACASSASNADATPATGTVTREYRTGSRFPVKDAPVATTQEERDRQLDEARAAARAQQTSSGAPRGAIGQ